MGWLFPISAFLVLLYLFAKWFRMLIIKYDLGETALRIRIFGVQFVRIPFSKITSCEVVAASKLWKPWNPLIVQAVWLHTRILSEGVVIKAGLFRYVVTPKNPDGFVKYIRDRANEGK